MAGVKLLPMMTSSAIGAFIAGGINSRKNLTSYTLLVASAFQILGYGLMITLGNTSPTPTKIYGFEVFLGLGFGLTMPTVTIIAQMLPERKWIRKPPAFLWTLVDRLTHRCSRDARRTHPAALTRWKHRPRSRCHRLQQSNQKLKVAQPRTQSRPNVRTLSVASYYCRVGTEGANAGLAGLRQGIHRRDAGDDVHCRRVLRGEFSDNTAASSTAAICAGANWACDSGRGSHF